MLQAENLHFAWPGTLPLFTNLSFTLRPRVPLVLLGPNGTGKTTLLRCLLGLERLHAGRVLVGGQNLAALSATQAARHIAYVPQATSATFAFRAIDIVLMGRTPHLAFMASPTRLDRTAAETAMTRLAIAHLAERPFDELSGGERQLVLIARALAQAAPVLILDEPCASLDIANQMRIIAILRALATEGYAILLTTHLPDHAFLLAGEVAMLKDASLLGPSPPAELLTAETLETLYATPIDLLQVPSGRAKGQILCIPIMPC